MWIRRVQKNARNNVAALLVRAGCPASLVIQAVGRRNFQSQKHFKKYSTILFALVLTLLLASSTLCAVVAPRISKKLTTVSKEKSQIKSSILAESQLQSNTLQDSMKIRLQPKQSELWKLWDTQKHTRLGMGGARGGSKSGGGRRLMVLRRFTYPNTSGLILRRTYQSLYKSHLVKLFEEFPELREYWRESSKELNLPNGSRLFFDSAPSEKELSNYYSGEFADIMLDEAQEFSQGEIEKLGGSNRCTSNDDITCGMLFTFMPGLSEENIPPVGLDYLKRVFVDAKLRKQEHEHKWAFVQAFAWDNVEWVRKALKQDSASERVFYSWSNDVRRDYFIERAEFGRQLAGLTNDFLRDAWLYGKWGIFQGQYFSNFDYEKHTVDAADIKRERWHKCWIGGDWGDYHPACFYWFAEDENGVVTVYREYWSIGAGETRLGEEIGAKSANETIREFYLSWDAFGKLNKQTRKSIVEMISAALPKGIAKPTPAEASPGSRISGWRLISQMLDSGMLRISRDCVKLIECLPTLVRDMQSNPEDVLKVDHSDQYIGDDPADALRYGLQNMMTEAGVPLGEAVRRRLLVYAKDRGEEQIEDLDINTVAMMHKRLTLDEQRKRRSRRGGLGRIWRPQVGA